MTRFFRDAIHNSHAMLQTETRTIAGRAQAKATSRLTHEMFYSVGHKRPNHAGRHVKE